MPWGRCSWTWFTCDRGNLAQEWPQVCLSNTQGPSAAPVWLRATHAWPQPGIYAAARHTRQPLDRDALSFSDAARRRARIKSGGELGAKVPRTCDLTCMQHRQEAIGGPIGPFD